MSVSGISCEQAEDADLDVRYAGGTLSAAEADAFEAHFFGCDRCWLRVQRAVELRAVAAAGVPAGVSSVHERPPVSAVTMPPGASAGVQRRRAPKGWWGLAAAALIVVAVGVWSGRTPRESPVKDVVMRGAGDTLHLVATARRSELTAAWSRIGGAASYRVRLYSLAGAVLFERDQRDTSIVLAEGMLPADQRAAQLYWEVQALGRIRQPIARSGLVAARVVTR